MISLMKCCAMIFLFGGIIIMILDYLFMLTVPFWQKIRILHNENERIKSAGIGIFLIALFLITYYGSFLLTHFGK